MLSRTGEKGLGNFCHLKHTSKERHIPREQSNTYLSDNTEPSCQCLKTIIFRPLTQSSPYHPSISVTNPLTNPSSNLLPPSPSPTKQEE